MKTIVRTLDGLPIEEPILDAEGTWLQREAADAIWRAYEQTGTLTDQKVRETVEAYQELITDHVID